MSDQTKPLYCAAHGVTHTLADAEGVQICPVPGCLTVLTEFPTTVRAIAASQRAMEQATPGAQSDEILLSSTRARTLGKQSAFLAHYMKTCHIKESADAAEISRETHYEWLRVDPAYKQAFEDAKPIAADFLHDIAVERASKGWLEPVYQNGAEIGQIRKFDNRLLEFLLKGHKREMFGDKTELTGAGGQRLLPDNNELRVLVLEVLMPFPEARKQLAAKLLELDAAKA